MTFYILLFSDGTEEKQLPFIGCYDYHVLSPVIRSFACIILNLSNNLVAEGKYHLHFNEVTDAQSCPVTCILCNSSYVELNANSDLSVLKPHTFGTLSFDLKALWKWSSNVVLCPGQQSLVGLPVVRSVAPSNLDLVSDSG